MEVTTRTPRQELQLKSRELPAETLPFARENYLEVWSWLQIGTALPDLFTNPTGYVEFSVSELFLASVGRVSGDWLPENPQIQIEHSRAARNIVFNVRASPNPSGEHRRPLDGGGPY